MKLAEALVLREAMRKKLAGLRIRLQRNAVVQEGNKPYEQPDNLIKAAISVLKELEVLACKINETNMRTKLPDGKTLMEANIHLQSLVKQYLLRERALHSWNGKSMGINQSTLRLIIVFDVSDLQKQADDLATRIVELNNAILKANHKTELEE